jgi:hypothetical protein
MRRVAKTKTALAETGGGGNSGGPFKEYQAQRIQ